MTLGLEVHQSYKTLHYQTLSYLEFSGSSLVEIYFLHETEKDDVFVLQSN